MLRDSLSDGVYVCTCVHFIWDVVKLCSLFVEFSLGDITKEESAILMSLSVVLTNPS